MSGGLHIKIKGKKNLQGAKKLNFLFSEYQEQEICRDSLADLLIPGF